jgi:hypothetical protein
VAVVLVIVASACGATAPPDPSAICGNGVVEPSEVCDGATTARTCASVGLPGGALTCANDCSQWLTHECQHPAPSGCPQGRECGTDCAPCTSGSCTPEGVCANTSPVGPRILTFASNVTALSPGSSLILSAVVTDPDGIDNLIGGILEAPVSHASYGVFATSAAEGAYSLTLTWDAIDALEPINTPNGGATRRFQARFFDVEGHEAAAVLDVLLRCGSNHDLAVCDGSCTNLMTNPLHCGLCGNGLPPDDTCVDGKARCDSNEQVCLNQCIPPYSIDHCSSCGDNCRELLPAGAPESDAFCDVFSFTFKCAAVHWTPTAQPCSTLCASAGLHCGDSMLSGSTPGLACYASGTCRALGDCGSTPAATYNGSLFTKQSCDCVR